MKIIGITGGVGAGKSYILDYIQENYKARIIKTDEAAELLRTPGHRCYEKIVELLGNAILNENKTINKNKMAELIFSNQEKLEKINGIIHPEVNRYVMEEIEKEKIAGENDYFFIESALLIENHYDEICDELWYIDTKEEIRRERLKKNRGYSEEKISDIISKHLSEEEFKKHCQVILDNNGEKQTVYKQIDRNMGGI